jgi:small-conductance mechanosensitive channel
MDNRKTARWFFVLGINGMAIVALFISLREGIVTMSLLFEASSVILAVLFSFLMALITRSSLLTSQWANQSSLELEQLKDALVGNYQKAITTTGSIETYWFKGELDTDVSIPTKEQQETGRVPGGLRGLIQSVIKSRGQLFISAEADVSWLTPLKRQQLSRGEDLSEGTWWRLFRLFKESVTIYSQPCSLAQVDPANHKHASLQCPNDAKTATLPEPRFKKGKERLDGLLDSTQQYLVKNFFLAELKIVVPFVILCVVYFALSVALVSAIGTPELTKLVEAAGFMIIAIFAEPILSPIIKYVVRRNAPPTTKWTAERLVAEGFSSIVVITTIVVSLYFVNMLALPFRNALILELWSTWKHLFARLLILSSVAALLIISMKDLIAVSFEKTIGSKELIYDESFLSVIQKFGIAYVLIFFSAAIILSYQTQLNTSPDTVILTYVFIGSLVTGVLGYASRDSLEDFFSGVMLRVNPPFVEGDRIILPSGEVCDVVDIGMTMVTLYNVTLNAEIYVPNKQLTEMTITNVSRPDLELRLQLTTQVTAETGKLRDAELLLIDCAYFEPEVDQAIVNEEDFGDADSKAFWERHERSTVKSEIDRLTGLYPDLNQMRVPTGDNASQVTKPFETITQESIDGVAKARRKWKLNTEEANEDNRLDALQSLVDNFGNLCGAVFSIGDYRPELKQEIAQLITELSKEPTVHSRFEVSDGESSYVAVTLNVFTIHLERRYEVENKLNKRILDRLSAKKLLFGSTLDHDSLRQTKSNHSVSRK